MYAYIYIYIYSYIHIYALYITAAHAWEGWNLNDTCAIWIPTTKQLGITRICNPGSQKHKTKSHQCTSIPPSQPLRTSRCMFGRPLLQQALETCRTTPAFTCRDRFFRCFLKNRLPENLVKVCTGFGFVFLLAKLHGLTSIESKVARRRARAMSASTSQFFMESACRTLLSGTHTPAEKSSRDFRMYPFLLRTCSTNCLGHGHRHWHGNEFPGSRNGPRVKLLSCRGSQGTPAPISKPAEVITAQDNWRQAFGHATDLGSTLLTLMISWSVAPLGQMHDAPYATTHR